LLRSALAGAQIAFTTIAGVGGDRVEAALRAIDAALATRSRHVPKR
jgi:hypothetical protein